VTDGHRRGRTRFLVVHDYGMGGLWWWIWAESAQEVVNTLAEVEVVTDPETMNRAAEWSLAEVDLDRVDGDAALAELHGQRDEQRGQPGFGALAGRQRVFLRLPDEDDDAIYLAELGADGRRLRQVEVRPDGTRYKSTAEDWPFNPPFDLYDPRYAAMEIEARDFEEAWRQAIHDPEFRD
jgi:hypothetical protein